MYQLLEFAHDTIIETFQEFRSQLLKIEKAYESSLDFRSLRTFLILEILTSSDFEILTLDILFWKVLRVKQFAQDSADQFFAKL